MLDKLIKLEQEAHDFGFRWSNATQIIDQIKSECDEILLHLKYEEDSAIVKKGLQEEIGDLLHAAFSLCIFCKFDPEQTLEQSTEKFARRFAAVKIIAREEQILSLDKLSFPELMDLWDKAKERVG